MTTALPVDDLRRIALHRAHAVAAYDDAEDIAHDALLKVWRAAHRYPTAADIAKVTTTAVSNAAADARRRQHAIKRGAATVSLDATPSEDDLQGHAAIPAAADPEADALVGTFVDWCLAQCRSDCDRATVVAWARGDTPREQLRDHSDLFADIRDVYDVRRLVAARIRRAYGVAHAAD